jgi:hypothetical protein
MKTSKRVSDMQVGEKGTITHWVNQPDYVNCTLERTQEGYIITDTNGFSSTSVDVRHLFFCKIDIDKPLT